MTAASRDQTENNKNSANTVFQNDHAASTSFMTFITLTSMICGALVMVIEVLGSRVLGPFFGVSLFVWTSLITVTLVALALGYALGGFLSDRKKDAAYLYGIILAAGILILAIPYTKPVVLKTSVPLGLRGGALTSALMLFGPPLFLLGCVSPYIIKIAAREMKNIGRTVGLFYAISTMGSFLGTLLTGFVLIAYLGVNRIFEMTGCILVCLSVVYFSLFKRNFLILAVLLLPALVLVQTTVPVSKVMANGTTVREVFAKDSFYGTVKVVDYSYGANHTRELIIDGLIQGGIDMNNGLSVYEYAYFMEFLPYSINPAGKNCLVIGLGAGVVPMWYEKQGIRTDVIDIDPVVVDIARSYFGFRTSGDIIISDARRYLNTGHKDKKYDFIVLDVFNGDTTPGHILSQEALLLIKKRMTDRGVLAINLVGSLRENNRMTASVIRTLESVFSTVDLYPAFSEQDAGWGNLAIVAYGFPRIAFNIASIRRLEVHAMARDVLAFKGERFRFPADTDAFILSDDYNPIDFYDSWLKENVRKKILSGTDWDILI